MEPPTYRTETGRGTRAQNPRPSRVSQYLRRGRGVNPKASGALGAPEPARRAIVLPRRTPRRRLHGGARLQARSRAPHYPLTGHQAVCRLEFVDRSDPGASASHGELTGSRRAGPLRFPLNGGRYDPQPQCSSNPGRSVPRAGHDGASDVIGWLRQEEERDRGGNGSSSGPGR